MWSVCCFERKDQNVTWYMAPSSTQLESYLRRVTNLLSIIISNPAAQVSQNWRPTLITIDLRLDFQSFGLCCHVENYSCRSQQGSLSLGKLPRDCVTESRICSLSPTTRSINYIFPVWLLPREQTTIICTHRWVSIVTCRPQQHAVPGQLEKASGTA